MNESLAFLPFCVFPVPLVTRLRERMARLLSISTFHSRHSFFPVATVPLSPSPCAKIRNMTPPPSHHQPFNLRISFQVSSAVCFLLSPGASFVSGATLRVDAGGSLYSRLMWAIPGMKRMIETLHNVHGRRAKNPPPPLFQSTTRCRSTPGRTGRGSPSRSCDKKSNDHC